ncbi:MAG TPA: hypothetical protein VIX19_11620 [Terriglobales bacterium]
MPYNEGLLNTYTSPAGVDMSGMQFYAVSLGSSPPGVVLGPAQSGRGIAGVLQNNPLQGQAAEYQREGITKVAISANQTITGGTSLLQVDVGSTLTVATTGTVVAQALESVGPVAQVMIISAMLMVSNAPTP